MSRNTLPFVVVAISLYCVGASSAQTQAQKLVGVWNVDAQQTVAEREKMTEIKLSADERRAMISVFAGVNMTFFKDGAVAQEFDGVKHQGVYRVLKSDQPEKNKLTVEFSFKGQDGGSDSKYQRLIEIRPNGSIWMRESKDSLPIVFAKNKRKIGDIGTPMIPQSPLEFGVAKLGDKPGTIVVTAMFPQETKMKIPVYEKVPIVKDNKVIGYESKKTGETDAVQTKFVETSKSLVVGRDCQVYRLATQGNKHEMVSLKSPEQLQALKNRSSVVILGKQQNLHKIHKNSLRQDTILIRLKNREAVYKLMKNNSR